MLTVLIATHNGSKVLSKVLPTYCALEPPEGGWNLVIVDNASSDDTKEVITAYSRHLPLTYLYEPKLGKNAALNTGLAVVTGDLVVLTDDDVLPRPDWLRRLRAAAKARRSFSIFGGPIFPKWECPPADWLLAWVPKGPTFALLDGLNEGPINPRSVFGPNMALRAEVFQQGYRFDETIGPKGTNYAMGSEGEFLRRLAKAGFQAWHCRDAVVEHIIRSSQMNQEWVLARALRYGRGQYRLAMKELPNPPAPWLGVPMSLFREILGQGLRLSWATLSRDTEKRFKTRWQLNFLIGKVIEARRLRKERAEAAAHPGVGYAC